jgi:hypothetical protein
VSVQDWSVTADRDAPGDEVELDRRKRDACRERLKKAALTAHAAITEAGYTSGEVAVVTGLHDSAIRKLKSDGDRHGWRPPSQQVCEAIDRFARERLETTFGLAGLREELRLAQEALDAAEAHARAAESGTDLAEAVDEVHRPELVSYLQGLRRSLSAAARWLPHSRINDGFQERSVQVKNDPPSAIGAEGAFYDPGSVPRGDVSWAQAVKDASITVVLADAGLGKSWLLRHHALELGHRALADIEAGEALDAVTIPLWVHARDLAECWRNDATPGARIADGCLRALTAIGFPVSPTLRRLLAERTAEGKAPLCVLIDAYDEVFDDDLRESANLAIQWLSAGVRAEEPVRIILASRPAGYADPFDHRSAGAPDEADENEDDEETTSDDSDPRYLYLGILNEVQVRSLWQRWFAARGQPVPTERLGPVLAPYSPLRRFVRVPLIAAFCAWVAEAEPVASTRTGLYAQVVRRFLALSWKTSSPAPRGSLRQDGAARVRLEGRLAGLAWNMATSERGWQDALSVDECEEILAADGPADSSHSLLWGPVRQIGILVQPGVGPDMPLGDGPVMWIHRSVHEFLVARKLTVEPADVTAALFERRCWFHPAWANVLDFALGLESADRGRRLLLMMDRAAGDGQDGLGWFSTVMASADLTGEPPADLQRTLLDRVRLLHHAGLLSAVQMAKALSSGAGGDVDAIVDVLRDRLRDSGPDRELWEAFAWSGAPGRAVLEEVIRTAADTNEAAAALHRVDAAAAGKAMRDRIIAGLPCHAHDAPALGEVDTATTVILQERYLADPASVVLAEALGYTRNAVAQETLSRQELLTAEDAKVRLAAAIGLAAWYGNELDERGYALLRDMAVGDPDRLVRMRLRARLESVAESVPWVERALGTVFYDLHSDSAEPELDDLEAIAARLRSVGTGTRLAVTMLRVEPRLLRGPVPEAMAGLAARAMVGELDAQMTADVAHIVGVDVFVAAAIARLDRSDASEGMTRLALGICFAAPGDPAVFDALVAYAGRTRNPLVEASLCIHDLPDEERVRRLAHAMRRLTGPEPHAVQTWAYAMRAILAELPEPSRAELRGVCAEATSHVLSLNP